MRVNIYFSILSILVMTNFLFANVPAPRPPQEKVIWVQQNYSDFVFYFCTYNTTNEKIDENTFKIDESTFKIQQVELTTEKPLVIKRNPSKESYAPYFLHSHLVAVRKSINEKIKSNLNEKLLNVVSNRQDEAGIYDAYIPYESKICKDSFCYDTDFNSILVAEIIDNIGLRFKGFDKKGNELVEKKPDSHDSSSPLSLNHTVTWIVITLFSIAVIVCGIFFLRRNRRK